MTQEDLKQKLARLHEDLSRETHVDPELKRLLQTVDRDIHRRLAGEEDGDEKEDFAERLRRVEADFAARHRHLEPVLREVVHLLQRLGI
jgi:hypothetical protein